MIDRFDFATLEWRPSETHPLADLFPMLLDDDLEAMAEDIKANGQQTPIVINDAGLLIDGRNRLAACEIAGVEPVYTSLNGHDAEAFIWGANCKRRQTSKGQIAMVAAMGFNLAAKLNADDKRGRGRQDDGKASAAKAAGVSAARLNYALTVKDHALDLTAAVIAGKITLDAAYEQAKLRKKAQDWLDNGLEQLRKVAPELADRVHDQEISLEEARRLLEEAEREESARRDSVMLGLATLVSNLTGFEKSDALKRLPEWQETDAFRRYFPDGIDIEAAQRGLDAVKAAYQS